MKQAMALFEHVTKFTIDENSESAEVVLTSRKMQDWEA
jgi:hypothetical protein